jgi:hypothetical protein
VEKLIAEETEVIWVDSGIQHTKMNLVYQRPCVHPLEADSPRRLRLGEILWNMPLPPKGFGWQAPWFDDKRVIIQDTPTSAPLWSTVIDVPMLRHWPQKFRGLSNRDVTIQEFEVRSSLLTDEDMYGRSVRLSSIQADMQQLSEETIMGIQEKAMSLAPSLLRPRNKQEQPTILGTEPSSMTMISVMVTGASSPTLSDRLHLQPCHPPPEPGRSKLRYVDPEQISRAWQHRIPKKDKDDSKRRRMTRRPPLYAVTMSQRLDSDTTRRREVRRLMHAADYLKHRLDPGEDSEILLEDIVACCRSTLEGPKDGRLYLEALLKVRDMILGNTRRRGAWVLIEQDRNTLGDVLSLENRAALQQAMSRNPELLTLYGNNLLLAVIVAVTRIVDDPVNMGLLPLWRAVAEWELYQMGFKPADRPPYMARSRYDFASIYGNLLFRTRNLVSQKQESQAAPRRSQAYHYREGILIGEEGSCCWLLFKADDGRVVCGLLEDPGGRLGIGWYRCSTNPAQMSEAAEDILHRSTDDIQMHLAVTTVGKSEILWRRHEEGAGGWILLGRLDYQINEREGVATISWLKISELDLKTTLGIPESMPVGAPSSESRSWLLSPLKKIAKWNVEVKNVKCEVSLDTRKRAYVITFCNPELPSSGVHERFESADTLEIVSVLRSPMTGKQQVVTKDGAVLTWDHLKDIDYGVATVPTRNGEVDINLSFLRPLVHRSRFFGGEYVVPLAAAQLFTLEMGPPVTIRVLPWDRRRSDQDLRRLRVTIDALDKESDLKGLEERMMNVWDVALLTDCEQLIDVKSGLVHPVRVSIRKVVGLEPPDDISDSRLVGLLSELEEESYGSDEESDSYSDEEQEKRSEAEEGQMAFVSARVIVGRRKTVMEYRIDVTLTAVDDRKSVEMGELVTVRWEKGLTGANYEGLAEEISANLRKQGVVEGDLWEATQDIMVLLAKAGLPVPEG